MKIFSKLVFLLLMTTSSAEAQQINFIGGHQLSLEILKKRLKTHTVTVFNDFTRSSEKYLAFPIDEVLTLAYGGQRWRKNFAIKVKTKKNYPPIIEMYKFEQRKGYLAYARADQKAFTTIGSYKDKIITLAPFYLIWKEDYKKNAARRRTHWTWKIESFQLQKFPPFSLIPGQKADQAVKWGYKNFLKQCMACHQIKGIGGERGGELITNKRLIDLDDDYLRKYISNPRSINKKSKMPQFPEKIDIRKKRITDIIKYLRFMQTRSSKKSKRTQKKSLDQVIDDAKN